MVQRWLVQPYVVEVGPFHRYHGVCGAEEGVWKHTLIAHAAEPLVAIQEHRSEDEDDDTDNTRSDV